MAKPAPCQRCLEVPDADYYLSNRLDNPWPFDQATVALCFSCLVQVAMQMADAYAAAMAQLQAEPIPGALEAIEADEGPVRPARADSKSKTRKAPEEIPATVPAAAETQEVGTDDHR